MSKKIKVLCTASYKEGDGPEKKEIWTKGHTYDCKEKNFGLRTTYEVETNMQQCGYVSEGHSISAREFFDYFEVIRDANSVRSTEERELV